MCSLLKSHIRRWNAVRGYVTIFATLSAALGCSSGGPEKIIVTGTVSYQGQPLPVGKIQFVPLEGTIGPVSSGQIKDGKYVIENKSGVPVGRHQVKIEGYRKATTVPPGMSPEDLGREQYLPAKYNSTSELTEEIKGDESPAVRNYAIDG